MRKLSSFLCNLYHCQSCREPAVIVSLPIKPRTISDDSNITIGWLITNSSSHGPTVKDSSIIVYIMLFR